MPSTADKARKSSRRQRAAESLGEHLDDPKNSAEIDYYEEEDVAESWSSHDISAGASKSRENRRGSTASGSSSSRRRADSSLRKSDGSRSRSPSNGTCSSNSKSVRDTKSAYKALGKLAPTTDEGNGSFASPGDKRRARKPGDRMHGSHRGDSSSNLSMSSSSRRRSESGSKGEAAGGSDKLQRILELGNKWKNMKEQHEQIAEQATTRRVDLKKEIF